MQFSVRRALPRIGRVAVLLNPETPVVPVNIGTTAAAARVMPAESHSFAARKPAAFESALATIAVTPVDAAAVVADRFLKGAKSANLPVEQAAGFELVVNRKAAINRGVSIAQALPVRTNEVIP